MPNHASGNAATNKIGRWKAGIGNFRWSFLGWSACGCLIAVAVQAAPRHVYLTWQGDTSRTITVNYQTLEPTETSTVYFDTQSRKGRYAEYRHTAAGRAHQIPGLADGRKIHWVELGGLTPGQTYHFIAGDPQHGFTAERKFRTVPAGSQSLRFVVGGDMGTSSDGAALLQQSAKLAPAFGVVGGDLAYADDALRSFDKWDAWLDHWETNMVTPAGYTVPMVLAIGNHEVRGGTATSKTNAQFYFRYFAQDPERSYCVRTFGKNVAMFLLDSGHLSPQGGEQAAWLDAQLTERRGLPYKFAAYHVPLYPSVRAFDGSGSAKGRNAWLPLFDQHHLTTAFEHHDHAFKRSQLLRAGKPDGHGTLYLGDGCWGMAARKVDSQLRWYEVKAASLQHFWCVDVSRRRVEYRAIDKAGQVFDVYPPDAAGASAAEKAYQALTRQPPTAGAKGDE